MTDKQIVLKEKTYNRLLPLKIGNMTFDEVVSKVLDHWEMTQK